MAKFFIFCFLLLPTLFLFGQNLKTVSINTEDARPLKLSEIAENVIPIALDDCDMIPNQSIFLTNEYLFVTSIRSIIQYNLSGMFIRVIDCGGYITDNVAYDTANRKLYVPVGDKIKSYDYFGQLEKEYFLKVSSIHCLYHKGVLWVQSYDEQPDMSFAYAINKINLTTGEVTTLPYKKQVKPYQVENGGLVNLNAMCRLTIYHDEVVASFDNETTIYKIQQEKFIPISKELDYKMPQDKVVPFVTWNIKPPAKANDIWPLRANGFVGDYLYINYRRDNQFYIYLENMKTGKKYNVSQLIDDVFYTEGHCKINSMNQEGCFVFIKDRSDIKGDGGGMIPIKNGPVVFIVKTK